jgi:hypothetical protein
VVGGRRGRSKGKMGVSSSTMQDRSDTLRAVVEDMTSLSTKLAASIARGHDSAVSVLKESGDAWTAARRQTHREHERRRVELEAGRAARMRELRDRIVKQARQL